MLALCAGIGAFTGIFLGLHFMLPWLKKNKKEGNEKKNAMLLVVLCTLLILVYGIAVATGAF